MDKDDIVDTVSNPFMDRKNQNSMALGRLCDQTILEALIDKSLLEGTPLQEDFNTAATQTDQQRHYAVGKPTQQFKDVCFIPADKSANAANAVLFDANSLEDVKHVFRKRDLSGVELICAFTPDLQLVLRKDTDFKNAENVYADRAVADMAGSGKGFRYKGIRFIEINEDALPELSTDNIASAYNAGTEQATLKCRVSNNTDLKGKTAASLPASSATAGAVVKTVSGVQKKDMIYIWESKAVYFAQRGELDLDDMTTRPDYSMAQQLYSRVNIGAMLIDEDEVLVMPLRGTVAA